jgi:hypothetical protein
MSKIMFSFGIEQTYGDYFELLVFLICVPSYVADQSQSMPA